MFSVMHMRRVYVCLVCVDDWPLFFPVPLYMSYDKLNMPKIEYIIQLGGKLWESNIIIIKILMSNNLY